MPPKKRTEPPRGGGGRGRGGGRGGGAAGGRVSGQAPGGARPMAGNAAASDASVDIVFSKPKPRAKGHRQRGAGTVMSDPGSVEKDGITVLSWQRLPSQLIQQHADRLHLKAPRYQAAKPSEPDLHLFQIVIPDRKNSAKDLSFLPTMSFSTPAQAKEHAALLALVKLQQDQPLERKLPEPYKTSWLQSVAEAKGEGQRPLARWEKAKKAREEKAALEEQAKVEAAKAKAASLGPIAADAAAEEELKKKNDAARKAKEKPAAVVLKAHNQYMSKFDERKSVEEKERKLKDAQRRKEAWARSNSDMKVMMNARLRRLLEEVLGLTEERERHKDNGVEHHGLTVADLGKPERAVLERIRAMGFPADDVLRAMAACPSVDETSKKSSSSPAAAVSSSSTTPAAIARRADTLLEWLCLHLAEHELPEGFDPRGKMLDVIQPGKNFSETAVTSSAAVESPTMPAAATVPTTTTAAAAAAANGSSISDPLQRRLLEYGFRRTEVASALEKTATIQQTQIVQTQERSVSQQQSQVGTATTADPAMLGPLGVLAQGLLTEATVETSAGGGGAAEASALRRGEVSQTEEEALEATNEEVESLQAIYADAVVVSQNMPKGSYLLTFDLRTLASTPTETWLDVWILRAGSGEGGYPGEAPPIALVREGGRKPGPPAAARLRASQMALARRAASLVGDAAVYDILVWAIEELPGILAKEPDRQIPPAGGSGDGGGDVAGISASIESCTIFGSSGGDIGSSDAAIRRELVSDSKVDGEPKPLLRLPGASDPLFVSSSARSGGDGSGGGGGGGGSGSDGDKWRRYTGAGGGGNDGDGKRDRGRHQNQGQQHPQHRRSLGALPPGERKRGRERVEASKEFAGRRRQRGQLPAAAARAEFLEMVRGSQVVLVSGETGCGKTTQIPQFLLEEWEEGVGPDEFRVLVTQPRRIAAVGVAQRVADERCERVGAGVGYQIRGESKVGADTRLLFCTTGLLLRRMQGDPLLDELTHLIVDEVHERHLDADFLLALLIGILPKRPKLKVILMSATLDTARFAAYFSGLPGLGGKDGQTPILHIPGRTFPVRDLYLEDALSFTGHRPRLKRRVKKKKKKTKGESGAGDQEGDGDDGGNDDDVDDTDDDDDDEDLDHEELAQREREDAAAEAHTGVNMEMVDEDHLDYQLIVSLILFAVSPEGEEHLGLRPGQRDGDAGNIVKDAGVSGGGGGGGRSGGSSGGSVLVFMPGTGEIDRLCRELEHSTEGGQGLWVLPLHGSLPPAKQRAVFDPAPRGQRKVVVSTNIAETSITIPDVTVVVDSCRVKEMGYDVARQMPRLQQAWASQDSLTQRKGRAGRVREGVSFKLIRRRTFAKLPAHGTPEIRRVPLDPLVLQVKALGVKDHPSVVLRRALDPPHPKTVQDAVDTLTELKALDEKAELTPLGWHLAALPCPVQMGKMLIYGAVLGCLSPVLSIAAGLSCRSPFLSNRGQRGGAVTAAKKRMAELGGGRSDHTLLAVAVAEWDAAGDGSRGGGKGGGGGGYGGGGDIRAKKIFCAENGLSFERMRELGEVRRQLAQALAGIGFIADSRSAFDPRASVNAQAGSWRAVKAAVCAGLYPRVMRVVRPMERFVDLVGIGAVPVRQKAKEFQFFTRAPPVSAGTAAGDDAGKGGDGGNGGGAGEGGRTQEFPEEVVETGKDLEAFVHPASINYTTNDWSCPWLVYHERVRTSAVFVRDCTEVSPYALLLFGGKVTVQAGLGRIAVDDWVRFEAIGRIAALVNKLRQRLDAMLLEKIRNPKLDVAGSRLSEALVELLQTDGMG